MKSVTKLAIAASLSIAAPAIAQSASTDFTFASRTTHDSSGTPKTSTMRWLIAGSRVRMESSYDPPKPSIAGMYSVLNLADSTQMEVMPGNCAR